MSRGVLHVRTSLWIFDGLAAGFVAKNGGSGTRGSVLCGQLLADLIVHDGVDCQLAKDSPDDESRHNTENRAHCMCAGYDDTTIRIEFITIRIVSIQVDDVPLEKTQGYKKYPWQGE